VSRTSGAASARVQWLITIALACLSLLSVARAQSPAQEKANTGSDRLRGGWYPWDPYQYRDYKRAVPILTGFDVEIERALARIMSIEIDLSEDHIAALATGKADIGAGATASGARTRYAYFSKPYRTETDVLILPRGFSGRYSFHTVEEMLDTFAKQKFRLGIVSGFVYCG
jgi:polar amino acid transport system substrate-binding protein